MQLGEQAHDRAVGVCLDQKRLRDHMRSGECIVYAFGVQTEWSFEASASMLGCVVYAFDPSVMRSAGSSINPGIPIVFYPYGISDHDHDKISASGGERKWRMRTVQSIMKEFNHSYVDVLKFDAEGKEWDILPGLSQLSSKKVGQIVSKLHLRNENEKPEPEKLSFMRAAGWKLWRRHENENCYLGAENGHGLAKEGQTRSCCYDVGWMPVDETSFLGPVRDRGRKWVQTECEGPDTRCAYRISNVTSTRKSVAGMSKQEGIAKSGVVPIVLILWGKIPGWAVDCVRQIRKFNPVTPLYFINKRAYPGPLLYKEILELRTLRVQLVDMDLLREDKRVQEFEASSHSTEFGTETVRRLARWPVLCTHACRNGLARHVTTT